jgi:ribosomal protein S18 acetylase RimI-like enzyme
MDTPSANPNSAVRPLCADDLDRMIAIDRAHTRRQRRRFFEKRLAVAGTHPDDYIHLGVSSDGKLMGFVLARVLHGEFGREQAIAAFDVIGVDPEQEERGFGRALMQGLRTALRDKGVRLVHSQADWTNHGLLKFFDSAGFKFAPRLVLERAVAEPLAESTDDI